MKKPILIIISILFTFNAVLGIKPGGKKEWLDYEDALLGDPDFSILGEYGSAKEGGAKWGAQVVAMGDGKFDGYILEGGLPGAGWDRSKKRVKTSGTTDALKSKDGKFTAVIKDGKITISEEGKKLATLSHTERESPTLGKKAPKGAVVLFDGSNTDEWINPRLYKDRLMAETKSKRKFRDYTCHIEVMTTYEPFDRGQGRSNSGVYHQGRFETQVLDSFGLEGRMNEFGGIYSIAAPRLNMCFPPLRWQTYDVDFTAAKFKDGKKTKNAFITVRHNGVVIHENQELDHTTTAAPNRKYDDTPGFLYFQGHGNKVMYRNVWVLEK
ncbi:MAG: DUF1080 domain-containing protein [Opitutae bacterium]|nr:DUF1080 domain-containing protein [Opitutae bacterium]MBT5691236.1 DUF1080 domain-containing protein [Opitutae bacterium]MBT7854077.1 DUF1080 domain-containing protein [Opitutae bacterium]